MKIVSCAAIRPNSKARFAIAVTHPAPPAYYGGDGGNRRKKSRRQQIMCNGFGNNWWWIIILLLIFGNGNTCGCDNGCGCDNRSFLRDGCETTTADAATIGGGLSSLPCSAHSVKTVSAAAVTTTAADAAITTAADAAADRGECKTLISRTRD